MASPPEDVPLVTLQEAADHLRVDLSGTSPPDEVEREVDEKRLQASCIVVDYIKRLDHDWTETSKPQVIKTAVLLVLTKLYDHPEEDPISPAVRSVLERYRDPAVA